MTDHGPQTTGDELRVELLAEDTRTSGDVQAAADTDGWRRLAAGEQIQHPLLRLREA
jgi:hypothetical protein